MAVGAMNTGLSAAYDHHFVTASPGQGPFFELLDHAPADGLRLVRAVVEHATNWVRDRYVEARQTVSACDHSVLQVRQSRSMETSSTFTLWTRNPCRPRLPTSALMALEAWAHREIERGRPFEEVLHDVLGPDGSSIAFVAVAVDIVLSHWRVARDVAWPIVACPRDT